MPEAWPAGTTSLSTLAITEWAAAHRLPEGVSIEAGVLAIDGDTFDRAVLRTA